MNKADCMSNRSSVVTQNTFQTYVIGYNTIRVVLRNT